MRFPFKYPITSSQKSMSVLSCFSSPSPKLPHLLQDCVARLLNAMSSARVGRDYLCQDHSLINSLVSCLMLLGDRLWKVTREMIIATLQKLSLK